METVILVGPMFGNFVIAPRIIYGPFANDSEAFNFSMDSDEFAANIQPGEFYAMKQLTKGK